MCFEGVDEVVKGIQGLATAWYLPAQQGNNNTAAAC